MGFSQIDLLTVGVVALIAGVQFLRVIRDFSLILYETIFLILALIGAVRFYPAVQRFIGFSPFATFAGTFLVLAALAFLCAGLLNLVVSFEFGVFGYLLGFGLAIACGFVFGHAVLRGMVIGYGATKPQIVASINRSWMASQVLYFGAFRELLAMLRIARYNKI